jgi:acyl-CoA thioesterase-1
MRIMRAVLLLVVLFGSMINAVTQPVIVVLGDSLSAGYGIELNQGWVAQLQQRLRREGYPHRVVNASISGETTRGALARLDDLLVRYRPAIVIVALGGNDGLRGLSLQEMRENFSQIILRSKQAGARVLLITMRLPTNYGPVYIGGFQKLFDALVHEHAVPTAPFILEGIADRMELMQEDGFHPRTEAQGLMLDNVWPALAQLL